MRFTLVAVLCTTVAVPAASAQQADRLTSGTTPVGVRSVHLSYVAHKDTACPRQIMMRVAAVTDGPGSVRFVVRKAGGGKSEPLVAQSVRGANGQYSASLTQTFAIAENTRTRYMAEAVDQGKISSWIDFDERCGPQPRTEGGTRGPPPRSGRPVSELEPDPAPAHAGKPTDAGKPVPAGGGKPMPGDGKRICKDRLEVKRYAAATQVLGIATAKMAWQAEAAGRYGKPFDDWSKAQDREERCTGVRVYQCTVAARPCGS